jgi:hypothetical protein
MRRDESRRGTQECGRNGFGKRIALFQCERYGKMDTVVVIGAIVGSFAGAFALQKAALEGLFRMMNNDRRLRQ